MTVVNTNLEETLVKMIDFLLEQVDREKANHIATIYQKDQVIHELLKQSTKGQDKNSTSISDTNIAPGARSIISEIMDSIKICTTMLTDIKNRAVSNKEFNLEQIQVFNGDIKNIDRICDEVKALCLGDGSENTKEIADTESYKMVINQQIETIRENVKTLQDVLKIIGHCLTNDQAHRFVGAMNKVYISCTNVEDIIKVESTK